jgi:hypothetical protein
MDRLVSISENGRTLKAEIESLEETILVEIENLIKSANEQKVVTNGAKNKALEEMNALPVKVDLSDNQEYEVLCLEIAKKEEALKAMNTGADYRAILRSKKAWILIELDAVKEKISRTVKNVELEKRLTFLRKERLQKEQSKADCERILDLLDQLDRKKNELLVDFINSHFLKVKWQLFSFAKNGSYKKDYCVPEIDGFSLHDTANRGRVIEAMIDIATSIQKITGIHAPIILDNAESLDSENLLRIMANVDGQAIILSVTDATCLCIETA